MGTAQITLAELPSTAVRGRCFANRFFNLKQQKLPDSAYNVKSARSSAST